MMIPQQQPMLTNAQQQDQSQQKQQAQQQQKLVAGDGGGNRFFRVRSDGQQPERGRLYAAVEVPEPDEFEPDFKLREPIYLECIDTEWVQDRLKVEIDAALPMLEDAPLSVLELTNVPLPSFSEALSPGDIAWFEISYSAAALAEADASLYTNLYAGGTPVKVEFQPPADPLWPREGPFGKGLWKPSFEAREWNSSVGRVTDALIGTRSPLGVAIYDVGQGACQAAICEGHGIPLLYVDFGGGVLGNYKTFPANEYRGFCFKHSPAVKKWSRIVGQPGKWELCSNGRRCRRGADDETTAQEPFSEVQGHGGLGGDPG